MNKIKIFCTKNIEINAKLKIRILEVENLQIVTKKIILVNNKSRDHKVSGPAASITKILWSQKTHLELSELNEIIYKRLIKGPASIELGSDRKCSGVALN